MVPSLDFTTTPPRQSTVSEDSSAPENFDKTDCVISLSLALV
jgi:hypothetical protein